MMIMVIISTEAYLELSQTSRMEFFAKMINDWKPLTILSKSYILDIGLRSEYASETAISKFLSTLVIEENCVYSWNHQQ